VEEVKEIVLSFARWFYQLIKTLLHPVYIVIRWIYRKIKIAVLWFAKIIHHTYIVLYDKIFKYPIRFIEVVIKTVYVSFKKVVKDVFSMIHSIYRIFKRHDSKDE